MKAIVSVTNDLSTDQRVHKTCMVLHQLGFEVTLVGRERPHSLPMDKRPYQTHRMKLKFETGPMFYFEYHLHLFFYLLFHKADLLFANDLDALLPNFLNAKLKGCKLVYDSHEYYTGVPELQAHPFKQSMWKAVEKFIFPKLKYVLTVNDSIAQLYEKEYGVQVQVMRNIPPKREIAQVKTRVELGLPEDKKIVLLQGAGINVDRGAEEAVEAMQYLEGIILLIIGSGDVIGRLKKMAEMPAIKGKVMFIAKLPFEQLQQYTQHADLGLTLDKDTNINYRFSLPNKLFDYIQSGVPVLSSSLVEIEKIIRQYQVGDVISSHDPQAIAEKIKAMLSDPQQHAKWVENERKAAEALCWEKEQQVLIGLIKGIQFK